MADLPIPNEASDQEVRRPNQNETRSSSGKEAREEIEAVSFMKLCKEPNPHLQLDCIVRNSFTGEDIRHATAEFWLEGKDTSGNLRCVWDVSLVDEFSQPFLKDDPDQKDAFLKFRYSRAVVSGVDQVPARWPPKAKDSLSRLAVYRDDGVATIPLSTLISSSPRDVLLYLQDYHHGKLWEEYTDRKPFVFWNELVQLSGEGGPLVIKYPVPQLESRCHFSSVEEALVKLAVARYVEQKWEEEMFLELSKGDFEAAFILLGPNTAIAAVKRKDPRILIEPHAAWDDHMTIVLKFEAAVDDAWLSDSDSDGDENQRTVRMTGHVVSNQTALECEIVVLLDKIPAGLYDLMGRLDQAPRFIDLSNLYIEVIDQSAKNQVKSLNSFFGRAGPSFTKWWPMLLAEDASNAAQSNFLKQIGWSRQGFEQVLQKITEKMRADGKPLNQEQLQILSNAPYSRAGFKLIMGPPGCGKTTLIAMLAELYLGAPDTAVLVLAGSNGSTDRSFETLDKWIRSNQNPTDHQCPLRAYKKYLEITHFLDAFDPVSTQARIKAAKVRARKIVLQADEPPQSSFYRRQQEAEKRKHMNDPEKGIAGAVLKAVRDGELPIAKVSDSSARQRSHDIDRARAESSLSALKFCDPRLSSYSGKSLRPDVLRRVKVAFNDVARYIIGTKRLVVSTVGNTTSTILQDCLFRDSKHVVVIVDEAGLQTDTELIHVIAALFPPDRIRTDLGGENPIVTVVLVGDHKQGAPIVKSSEKVQANIFGKQLALSPFVRFTLSGFPVEPLWEQHRMVDILCKLSSKRGYGGKLRTSAQALSRRISPKRKKILMDLLNTDLTEVRCPLGKEKDYVEDQHLRHWLLDVRGGCTQTDPALQNSRFNVANVDVTLRFFRALVKSGCFLPSEIRILTFYNAQRQRYIDAICGLQNELGLAEGDTRNIVHTSDSFQGQEAPCVILDLVVTKYHGEGTLGHTGDEKKANVAFTRARDYLYVVGDSTILDSPYLGEKEGRVEFIFESMMGLVARKAVKPFHSNKSPESQLAGRFEKLSIKEKEKNGIGLNEAD